MSELKIGYARVSTDAQDLTAQRDALQALGVEADAFTSTTGSPAPTANGPGYAKRWRPVGPVTRW